MTGKSLEGDKLECPRPVEASHDCTDIEKAVAAAGRRPVLLPSIGMDAVTYTVWGSDGLPKARSHWHRELAQHKGEGYNSLDEDVAMCMLSVVWQESCPLARCAGARAVLERHPNCADALVVLAEESQDNLPESLELYEAAIEAGRAAQDALNQRVLPCKLSFREKHKGSSLSQWEVVQWRGLLRAYAGAGRTAFLMDDFDAATEYFAEYFRATGHADG